jgi:uncharacterized membrane protein YphA (DoxX/SURF4 family)
MKFLANFSRILVGIELVFSGFVKIVDPYGTGLKLQEYFEVFQEDVPYLTSFFQVFADNALLLSILFCVAEFSLGVALLVKFKMKLTSWAVVLMMVFFTFLTFYSAYFNKVTDCGCFGDFLKLKPWHSFYKDVISMVFILIIFFNRNSFGKFSFSNPIFLVGLLTSLTIGIYGVYYLPLVDFLPYAIGKSIPKQMVQPKVKPDIEYLFLDKTTKKNINSKEYLMDTVRFKYVSSEILNEDLLKAKITDYSVTDSTGADFTQHSFEGKKLLLIIKKAEGLENVDFDTINKTLKAVKDKEIETMVLSSLPADVFMKIYVDKKMTAKFYTTDEKVLKTMARNSPCLILLNKGVVVKKWPYTRLPNANEIIELSKNN